MGSVIKIILLLLVILPLNSPYSVAQVWIKAGYWLSGAEFPIGDINSALFTHLICAFGDLNSTTYELQVSSSDQKSFSAFTSTVKKKNPSVVTLLSIGGETANYSVYSSMVSQFSSRKSFIDSSISLARLYGFGGLDFSWRSASTAADATNMGTLLDEWRAAVESESRNNLTSRLILTIAAPYSQYILEATLPVESIRENLDWVHVMAFDYYMPTKNPEHTDPFAALYDPASNQNTDFGINSWIKGGLPPNKIVLGLPFYGYAWKLRNPNDKSIGAPANGSAVTTDGSMTYKAIRDYVQQYNAISSYNSTYVMRYCSVGSTWIGFDDIEVVKTKVSYAKQKNLSGYVVWQVPNDYSWELSQAAAKQTDNNQKSKQHILLKTLLPIASVIILFLGGFIVWHIGRKKLTSKELRAKREMEHKQLTSMEGTDNSSAHYPQIFSFDDIKAATNDFSSENKLGEGGYGPVYKVPIHGGRLRSPLVLVSIVEKASCIRTVGPKQVHGTPQCSPRHTESCASSPRRDNSFIIKSTISPQQTSLH